MNIFSCIVYFRRKLVMSCVILWIFVLLFITVNSYIVQVQVAQGTLEGTRESTLFGRRLYYAFYGVPYAERPVGKLRFKDPLRAKKWDRPYDATMEYRGACIQTHIVHKQAPYGTEDCLYMNIYTPSLPKNNKNSLKSIIVWIHGHTFTSSFSHLHGGDFFVDNDIVVITVTHRVGVFGFLDLNETDTNANMGLKDIVMALMWIRKNIEKFDGDKNKITLMASDSAATYVSLLLMTKSGNLFSKVILQSGGLFSPSIFQTNPITEKNKLSEDLKNKYSKDLMGASANDIIVASVKLYNSKDITNFQRPVIPFSPIVEKESNKSLIFWNPYTKYRNNLKAKIPVMIGFNSQESIAEVIPFIHNPYFLKSFNNFFKFMVPFADSCSYNYSSTTYKEIARKIKDKYFQKGISEKSVMDFVKYASDLIKYPIYKFIKSLTRGALNEIYVYKFNYVGKLNAVKANSVSGVNINIKGASKGDEVCYLMKCNPLWERYVEINKDTDNKDKRFIREITEIWANFAKTGNPTPRPYLGNVTWLPMNAHNDNVLLLSSNSKLISSKDEEKMYSFWNQIYEDYYSRRHCDVNKHDEL